jgi:DNA polymerase-3 subunit gamma/tau
VPEAPGPGTPSVPAPTEDLAELWQQILAGLELPSTRMLLSQQAQLIRLDERRAVVRVAGTWMAMVQSRLPLLEKAVAGALGSPRQLTLEAGGDAPAAAPASGRQAAPVTAPPVSPPTPPPAPPPPSLDPTSGPPRAQGQSPASGGQSLGPATLQPSQPQGDGGTPQPLAAAVAQPGRTTPIDEQARRLADFFNGEVVRDVGPDSV